MPAKLKTQSPLSYFGSDASVARDLGALFDSCKHVTIPFCGGMSILPWLKSRAIVANDLNDLAINFYKYASGSFGEKLQQELFMRCQHTLSHPTELGTALLAIKRPDTGFTVSKAWAYWAIAWLCRKGSLATTNEGKGMPSVRRTATGGSNASRIRSAANDLEAWAKEFERCEFTCVDFRECLAGAADDDQCGVYCDPCWLDDGDSYIHGMKWEDHVDLRCDLMRFEKTTVVVRYGDHEKIRKMYSPWRIIEATRRTQANKSKPEIWITNK